MEQANGIGGTQTLTRGLDILESIAGGRRSTGDICQHTGLTPETVRRLTRALLDRGYVGHAGAGLSLGRRVVTLAHAAGRDLDLIGVAKTHLARLAEDTQEAVHLAVEEQGSVKYVHMIQGRRRLALRSIVGETRPMTRTSLGKALMLDWPDDALRARYAAENGEDPAGFDAWSAKLRQSVAGQTTYDVAEFEPNVHCIGAPIRDASGAIVAAISISTIVDGPSDDWLARVGALVRQTSATISGDLGGRCDDRGQAGP